jgi:uridine kinase
MAYSYPGLETLGTASMALANICVVGICGGSGSGKTTLAKIFQKRLGEDHCTFIPQDNYYLDQSYKFDGDGGSVNFDHPSSIDFPLLATHIQMLKAGQCIQMPTYDFATHKRLSETITMVPNKIILVDGTLILSQEEILRELHSSVFIDIPTDVRFERRLNRDIRERGRCPDGVRKQFYSQVEPMHNDFVLPSKEKAKFVINNNAHEEVVVDKILAQLLFI